MPRKSVATDFSRAAAGYDAIALLQKQVLGALASAVSAEGAVLDAGTGTGMLAELLPQAEIIGLDIAEGMCRLAQARIPQMVTARMEALPLGSASVSAVVSSLALQWLPQPEDFLREACRVTQPDGRLHLATFTAGTLASLRSAYQACGLTPPVLDFPTAEEITVLAQASGWRMVTAETKHYTTAHENLWALLRHLKALGARHKQARGIRSKGDVARLAAAYPQADSGIIAEWEVVLISAEKPLPLGEVGERSETGEGEKNNPHPKSSAPISTPRLRGGRLSPIGRGDYFVTATGTDQGKTLVTTALCHQLRQQCRAVAAFKPIISGFDGSEQSDTARILRSLGRPVTPETIAAISPWRFAAPLSPDEAARQEGREVVLEEVIEFLASGGINLSHRERSKSAQTISGEGDAKQDSLTRLASSPTSPEGRGICIVEGAGGIMSPLSETATNLDLMVALGMKAILVSSSYLGCISPILTALLALQSRGVELAALVLVQVDPQALSTETVLRSLRPHLPAALKLASVPYLGSQPENWLAAPDILGILE